MADNREFGEGVTDEEQYLKSLYREANMEMAKINKAPGKNPAERARDNIPIARQTGAGRIPESQRNHEPVRRSGKTEEEEYLEKLYKGEEIEIPLQKSSLSDSDYQFHSIVVPDKSMSPLRVAGTSTRLLAILYMAGGLLMFFECIPRNLPMPQRLLGPYGTLTNSALEVGGYAFWAFLVGAIAGVLGIPVALKVGTWVKRRVVTLSIVALICVIMAIHMSTHFR